MQSDFDFLFGSWRVHNRKLRERLKGSQQWDEFEATDSVRPILDGIGNFGEFRAVMQGRSFAGVTLRTFDPSSREWSIYWADGWRGRVDPPMVGRFADGKGVFFGDDVHDGRPVRVRFLWTVADGDHVRWEQAFSPDQGATWETNWIMDYVRAGG
jgi:hypothetical protein